MNKEQFVIADGTCFDCERDLSMAQSWADTTNPDGSNYAIPGGYIEMRADTGGLLGYVTLDPDFNIELLDRNAL